MFSPSAPPGAAVSSFVRACCAMALAAALPAAAAPVISLGTPFAAPLPSEVPGLQAGSFLVPVRVAGADALQTWQFDLAFDPGVVQVVASDPFAPIPGLYGARFDAGDDASLSYLLGGFVFNDAGLVDDLVGSYPLLPAGVTGEGTLAYLEFAFVAGRERDDPRFAITGVPTEFTVPEPGTWGLAMLAVLLGAASRRRSPPLQETPA